MIFCPQIPLRAVFKNPAKADCIDRNTENYCARYLAEAQAVKELLQWYDRALQRADRQEWW